LIGVKPGEARTLVVKSTTPEGQKVDKLYRVEVKEVSERKLPALDDNLARDAGPFESLEHLRRLLRKDIENNAEQRSRKLFREEISEEILKHNPFELPEAYTQAFENAYFEDLKERFKGSRVNDEELRGEARAQTVRYLKWRYLCERIAEIEHVHVTDDEIRDYLSAVAKANKEDPQRYVNKAFNDERERERAHERLLEDKVLSLLEARMKVTPRHVAYKDRDRSRLITA
jgi:trigger factor